MGYINNMKTTIDIADNILLRAKKIAGKQNRTLKSLTEEGLSFILDMLESKQKTDINPVTFDGNGLQDEFADKKWSDIRDASYEGRGG
ncbi:MAG: hypothetical protein ACYTFY_16410 [Planctomycetota bacterium]|jgi:hypothetical protein